MEFPGLNDIVYPFLEALRNEHPYTRTQVAQHIISRLRLTDEQLALKTKNNIPLLKHRMAFCEGFLVNAGFVHREAHPSDKEQDTFTITPLGARQIRRKPDDLTVGYLRTFFMGRVYRGSGSEDTTSTAELDLFDAFEKLPQPYQVFHSVSWIAHETRKGSVGEIDFLIAHPEKGLLVIEVKGGQIALKRQGMRQKWTSTSYWNEETEIGDPIAQAERNRRNLQAWLENDVRTRRFSYAIFTAVAFPDMIVNSDIRPDFPKAIVIDAEDVKNLGKTLDRIFTYWKDHADQKNTQMSGKAAVDALKELIVPSRQLGKVVSVIFERERKKIEELTRRQFHVLNMLNNYRRAAIVGGAGTGKTMIAMEKAKQLALSGFRVLFLAFNRNITQWIAQTLRDENIVVSTFYGFVSQTMQWAETSQDDGGDFYNDAPDLLINAAQRVRETRIDLLFDAIIVDEAQDFKDMWWVAITEMLKSQDAGVLYIFYDDNQQLYQDRQYIPIEGHPFTLVDNCRNTQSIHAAMLPYALREADSFCDGPEGRPVTVISADTAEQQSKALRKLCYQLVESGIPIEEVAVLTPAAEERSQWKTGDILGNFVMTWDLNTNLDNAIRVSTIHGYKGLETSVIIMTELDKIHDKKLNQLMYIGLSRARHDVYIIGQPPKPV